MGLRFVPAPPVPRALRSLATCLAVCAALGCAGGKSSPTGTGGKTGSGSAGTTGSGAAGTTGSGSAGTTGSGSGGTTGSGSAGTTGAGTTGHAGTTGTGAAGTTGTGAAGTTGSGVDASVSDAACQSASYTFAPLIPTVYLLVDRSGSMFHCLTGNTGDVICADMTNTSWYNLKTAIESVLPQLESQVRFGFTTVFGANPVGGGMCPSLQGMLTNNVSPALNNAGTIKTLYDSLPFPPNSTQQGVKFESPASESLGVVNQTLTADADLGAKYIIFITDGQPDYCDDSNSLCAPDSVVWQLQNAYTAGIHTIVMGVQTSLFDLAPGVLQSWANAGAGEATLAPFKTGGSVNDFYDQCNGVTGWAADRASSGKPNARGTTLGTYSTTMGTTTPYTPSASNQSQLVSQLSAALSGVKTCTFDLSDVNGKSLKVDLTKLAQAKITIEGATIPQDATNGWSMSSASELVLNGSACATWRMPNNNNIQFGFPCTTIIFE
jgi:hypothetical protein